MSLVLILHYVLLHIDLKSSLHFVLEVLLTKSKNYNSKTGADLGFFERGG